MFEFPSTISRALKNSFYTIMVKILLPRKHEKQLNQKLLTAFIEFAAVHRINCILSRMNPEKRDKGAVKK
jgi:hypothetical protein